MRIIRNILIILLFVFSTQASYSQIIAPTGIATRASSQLVYMYDSFDPLLSWIQVTNRNDTTGVWIHVQIFRSFDTDNEGPTPPTLCDERNFVDFLTPNDTHTYELFDPNFHKNMGESEGVMGSGELTSIDVTETKGFVVITPVVSESDLTAISFQHLFGKTHRETIASVNAVGRDAVNFTTGEVEPDGTPLDGVTNGYVVLQPEELLFDFIHGCGPDDGSCPPSEESDVIGIAFSDNYGPPGLLGYQVVPGEVTWTSFIFDFKEDPTSCGNLTVSCYSTVGLNDSLGQFNFFLNNGPEQLLLCGGASSLIQPDTESNFASGWTRIFVSGLDDFENHIGFFTIVEDPFGTKPMFTRGERTEIITEPPAEDCAVEGDEDEDGFADCLDTDCATAEECETGETECADGMDNDEDGQTDCADLGCDGFAGCEFGTETSCEDGIDNDADGDVDGADSDCQASDDDSTTGGDGGDGGGCTVASAVTASTAANFLLPLLPLFVAYGIRRMRKKVLGP